MAASPISTSGVHLPGPTGREQTTWSADQYDASTQRTETEEGKNMRSWSAVTAACRHGSHLAS
eukprot:CAMPEP_0175325530 /NCGR_PEP_ID=MMETSP0093-20121207/74059_1 /TAXON_ID=311494 /ORGANISM="Alexandrium monilatum, Strain CCMP3105" /LENGTH=62 /DNA_ID=CAMNT_0016622495 /DNA_START=35 /DNA_END=220 /DNA_ORIENTATION=+